MDYKQFEGLPKLPITFGTEDNHSYDLVIGDAVISISRFGVYDNKEQFTRDEMRTLARLFVSAPSILSRCQELERENKRISDALGQISETIFWPTTLKEYEYFYLKATEMARAALKKG